MIRGYFTATNYKNRGIQTNNKVNYGTETCKCTIVIIIKGSIIGYLSLCNGKDVQGHKYTAGCNRINDIDFEQVFIFILMTMVLKKRIGKGVIT